MPTPRWFARVGGPLGGEILKLNVLSTPLHKILKTCADAEEGAANNLK